MELQRRARLIQVSDQAACLSGTRTGALEGAMSQAKISRTKIPGLFKAFTGIALMAAPHVRHRRYHASINGLVRHFLSMARW
jgi:hypothetical protein